MDGKTYFTCPRCGKELSFEEQKHDGCYGCGYNFGYKISQDMKAMQAEAEMDRGK